MAGTGRTGRGTPVTLGRNREKAWTAGGKAAAVVEVKRRV